MDETVDTVDEVDANQSKTVNTLRKAVKTSPVGSTLIVSDGQDFLDFVASFRHMEWC